MLKSHHYLLATACAALVGAAAYAPGASAATCNGQTNCSLGLTAYTFGSNDIFGAGSSLVAPYFRQTADCYANPADLIFSGSPPTFADETLFDYTGSPPLNCATTHIVSGKTAWYISTGSGTGIKGVFAHDPTLFGDVNKGNPTQQFPEVHYGLSDAALAQSDVNVYASGGSEQGLTFGTPGQYPCGNAAPNYANPQQCFGPLIQFPFSIDPVAFAYNPVYEQILNGNGSISTYSFHVKKPRADGSGGLRLSPLTYCLIFNGQITNWNDSHITADNGGKSLADPNDPNKAHFSVPLIPVGRSDSSGTTFIITRHLYSVCQGLAGVNNLYTVGGETTLQAAGATSIIGNTYSLSNPNFPGVDQAGKFTLAPGSNGIAQYVAFTASPVGQTSNCTVPAGAQVCITQGRIAYIGPDYVLPYVNSTNTNPYGLNSATVENQSGQWEEPTPAGAAKAFSVLSAPTGANAADPANWVQGGTSTILGDPSISGAYPIVGTTNFLGYTCYAQSGATTTITKLLNFVNNAKTNWNTKGGILATAGLSPLPASWRSAIQGDFVTNSSGLGLNISTVGAAGTCSTAGIVGG